ncbi:MAG: hypothetical protein GDA52_10965 [Rhodobacteraceae bacterium]|nr:hypothetical protein [Paracoccaceae bacterium]
MGRLGNDLIAAAKKWHRLGDPTPGPEWVDCALVFDGLAPWYIPEHQAMLDAVHRIATD